MLHIPFPDLVSTFQKLLHVRFVRRAVLTAVAGLMVAEAEAKMNLLYTTENNLPSSPVNQVEESADEMIWLSTEDGLCRFDG